MAFLLDKFWNDENRLHHHKYKMKTKQNIAHTKDVRFGRLTCCELSEAIVYRMKRGAQSLWHDCLYYTKHAYQCVCCLLSDIKRFLRLQMSVAHLKLRYLYAECLVEIEYNWKSYSRRVSSWNFLVSWISLVGILSQDMGISQIVIQFIHIWIRFLLQITEFLNKRKIKPRGCSIDEKKRFAPASVFSKGIIQIFPCDIENSVFAGEEL